MKADGGHSEGHVNCEGFIVAKNILLMIGQDVLELLWENAGKVQDRDTFEQAIKKVQEGITGQTNKAVCRYKLYTKLPQGEKQFYVWYPLVTEQALHCCFQNYDADHATRDAILNQTSENFFF